MNKIYTILLFVIKCNLLVDLSTFLLMRSNFLYISFADSSITKDNPAFSMFNDSEEEVIYGSDEDSRRPLTRAPRNAEDSD